MKATKFLIFLLSIYLAPLGAFASGEDDPSSIAVVGRLKNQRMEDLNYSVEIYDKNQLVETVNISDSKTFELYIPRNTHCTVRILKDGYFSKMISFNTELEQDIKRISLFKFEVFLIKKEIITEMDDSLLDYPVALVNYNEKNKRLEFNGKYDKKIKKAYKKLMKSMK